MNVRVGQNTQFDPNILTLRVAGFRTRLCKDTEELTQENALSLGFLFISGAPAIEYDLIYHLTTFDIVQIRHGNPKSSKRK